MTAGRVSLAASLLLLLGWTIAPVPWACGFETDRMRAPKEESQRMGGPSLPLRGSPLREAMRFFQTTISRVDGDRCPMYPTCSQYGQQALSRHGAVVGLLMIVDRLFHEWSETASAPQVVVHGVRRFWDPVEENDFWFATPERPARGSGLKEGRR